jgi:hypothetical protein
MPDFLRKDLFSGAIEVKASYFFSGGDTTVYVEVAAIKHSHERKRE